MNNSKSPSVHFSSASDNWATPQYIFNELDKEFNFVLDPCSSAENAKCEKHYTIEDDGLKQDWGIGAVFMNPPYGREIRVWMDKANDAAKKGATVVCLVPARTDTRWWHDCAIQHEVRFIKGRLKFGGHKNNAPFPSAIVIVRGDS
jgi:phage N-6-adenine-methyltransferase